jgi:hypothetical protein
MAGALSLILATIGVVILCTRGRDSRLLDFSSEAYVLQRIRESGPLPSGFDASRLTSKTVGTVLRDHPPLRRWLLDILQNTKEKYQVRQGAEQTLFEAQDADTQRKILTDVVTWVCQTDQEAQRDKFRRVARSHVIVVCMGSELPDADCLNLLQKLLAKPALRVMLEHNVSLPEEAPELFPYTKPLWKRIRARSGSLLKILDEQKSTEDGGEAGHGLGQSATGYVSQQLRYH